MSKPVHMPSRPGRSQRPAGQRTSQQNPSAQTAVTHSAFPRQSQAGADSWGQPSSERATARVRSATVTVPSASASATGQMSMLSSPTAMRTDRTNSLTSTCRSASQSPAHGHMASPARADTMVVSNNSAAEKREREPILDRLEINCCPFPLQRGARGCEFPFDQEAIAAFVIGERFEAQPRILSERSRQARVLRPRSGTAHIPIAALGSEAEGAMDQVAKHNESARLPEQVGANACGAAPECLAIQRPARAGRGYRRYVNIADQCSSVGDHYRCWTTHDRIRCPCIGPFRCLAEAE